MLVTRPAAAGLELAARLEQGGWQPVLAPLLRIETFAPSAPRQVAATLVTSGNAVPAIPPAMRERPVLAVGDATAALARAQGCADVRSASGDASALARLAAGQLSTPGPLLLLSGRGQGAQLATVLRGSGFHVHRRTAYAARPVTEIPQAALDGLRAGTLRAAPFLSAETARTFVRLLPPALHPALAEIDALAIGEPAAAALRPLPWRRILVSGAPTLEALLDLL